MEFDLEDFMFEVTSALQYNDPLQFQRPERTVTKHGINHRPQESLEPATAHEDLDSTQRGLSVAGCQPVPSVLSDERQVVPEPGNQSAENVSRDINDGSRYKSKHHDILEPIYPDIDMSSAIFTNAATKAIANPASAEIEQNSLSDSNFMSSEPLNLVPKFYSYSVRALLLPIRKVQHDLVMLYFRHIHPMFPVVDEFHITQLHQKYRGQEEFMDPGSFAIYHALMAAAFAHLNEAQLLSTPYRSLHEGQESQFDQVKALHWSQATTDPIIATQISLILSLWSSGDSLYQNNSYWLDMAFKYATRAKVWDSATDNASNSRGKLLWWCCLVRDRTLAIGMRRPYRLHKGPEGQIALSEKDFGLESQEPSYTDIQSKGVEIAAFIWFCNLSNIMAAIALFQRRVKFSRDWAGDSVGKSSSEFLEVMDFDRELSSWREEFEAAVVEIGPCAAPNTIPLPISILRVINYSLLAGLYQPYLHFSWDASEAATYSDFDPLSRIKEGSRGVALSVADIMTHKNIYAIPIWLVAWIALPVAVYYVSEYVAHESKPDDVMIPFLRQLTKRSNGAELISRILSSATKDTLVEMEIPALSDDQDMPLGSKIPHQNKEDGSPGQTFITEETEARMLAAITKVLNLALELNGRQS